MCSRDSILFYGRDSGFTKIGSPDFRGSENAIKYTKCPPKCTVLYSRYVLLFSVLSSFAFYYCQICTGFNTRRSNPAERRFVITIDSLQTNNHLLSDNAHTLPLQLLSSKPIIKSSITNRSIDLSVLQRAVW